MFLVFFYSGLCDLVPFLEACDKMTVFRWVLTLVWHMGFLSVFVSVFCVNVFVCYLLMCIFYYTSVCFLLFGVFWATVTK